MSVQRYENVSEFPQTGRRFTSQASVQYDDGQLVRFRAGGNGDIDNEVETGETVLGICEETKASSDTSTDPILITPIRNFDEVLCKVTTGTVTAGEVGDEFDFDTAGEDGITLTESNNDGTGIAVTGETDELIGVFKNLYFGGTT